MVDYILEAVTTVSLVFVGYFMTDSYIGGALTAAVFMVVMDKVAKR